MVPLTPLGSNTRQLLRSKNALEYYSKDACQGEGRFSAKCNSCVFYVLGAAFGYGSEQDNAPILVGLTVWLLGAEEATDRSATAESCGCVCVGGQRKFQKQEILEFSITEL